MRMLDRRRLSLAVTLLLVAFAANVQAQITIGATPYATLNDAVNAANPGDTILMQAGTYPVTATVNVDVGVTIQGAGEGSTTVQVNTSGYGFLLQADDITLEDFSIQSIYGGASQGYVIHGQGTSSPGLVGWNDLTIRRVTIYGDATTDPKRRAGIDIHGFNDVLLEDVESHDASWGNGIQLTGCVGVDVNDATTSNNAWGSLSVYCSQPAYMNRGSDDVVIDGATFSGSDTVANIIQIFTEDEFGLFNTNVSVTGWDYNVRNTTHRADADEFTFFVDTLANANAFALAFVGFEDASSVQRISDGHFLVSPGLTIQAAVDAASSGGTVEVAAGSYTEQVEIAKDLTLQGDDATTTTIVSPANLVDFFTTSSDNYPVVYVHDADDVTIRDLTVDGDGQGNANTRFYGIAYRNAGGGVYDSNVHGTRNEPLDGSQHGNAIYLYNDDTIPRSFAVQGCEVYDFQKNGITVNSLGGTATAVDISGNTVTGAGVLTADNGDPAQNGIQVYGSLIYGVVDDNDISGIAYDNTNNPTKYVATCALDFFSNVDFTNNTMTGAQVGVYKYDGAGSISGNVIGVEKTGVSSWGVIATDPPRAVPQPVLEDGLDRQGLARRAVLNVLVDGNDVQFTGPDNTGTFGIEADAGYGPDDLAVTITNNTVNGFEVGVDIWECQSGCDTGVFTSVDVNQNDLSDNTFGLRSNATAVTVQGGCNWYGDASGPFHATLNPVGTGSTVEGGVVFEPWLDGVNGNCTLSTNYASVGPAPSELGVCNTCIDVPVSLTRLDTSTARGVSVTFQLSAELELCGTPSVSSGAGTFYDGFVSDVQSFMVVNGGGSYTFDTAILGATCGPTTGGEVFTIPVTYAAGILSDTTGSITITDVTMRDCANAPLPLLPGPGTTVDIDVTAPGAISGLSATQVKSGNDGNGTTKIDLSWTLPADLDLTSVEIFRKGFGDYPEYDDGTGAVPTPPANPTAALGDGWTAVATLGPAATSYTDEPNTRDFWYYVAYANDECSPSPTSNQTDGTLNYHLGDVAPAPNGNNQVFTGDISALGAAYGTQDGDVDYSAVADVGPTTDFSVDARPTTDDRIQFEDLIVFAINYNAVGRFASLDAAAVNELTLVEPVALTAGEEIRVPVTLAADGSLQGLSTTVAWNETVLEYLGWAPGDLPARQNRPAPVYSPAPGTFDLAVMGVTEQALAGEGAMVQLRFRVKKDGPTDLRFENVDARDVANEAVELHGTVLQSAPGQPSVVSRSMLRTNVPNPFNPSTKVRFALAAQGQVDVKIYDVAGRLVRTLVSGVRDAGEHEIVWDGTDDGGRGVSSGTYLLRMEAPDRTESRRMMLVK